MNPNYDIPVRTSHEDEMKKVKEKDRKAMLQMLNMTFSFYDSMKRRLQNIKDPSHRYTVLLDRISCLIDIATTVGKGFCIANDFPLDVQERFEKILNDINNDIAQMFDWIQQPMYSPDHPFGKKMLDESRQHFESS